MMKALEHRFNEILRLRREIRDIEKSMSKPIQDSAEVMWSIIIKKYRHHFDFNTLPKQIRWAYWLRRGGTIETTQSGVYVLMPGTTAVDYAHPNSFHRLTMAELLFNMWAVAKDTRNVIRQHKRKLQVERREAIRADMQERFRNAEREFKGSLSELRDIAVAVEGNSIHLWTHQRVVELLSEVDR